MTTQKQTRRAVLKTLAATPVLTSLSALDSWAATTLAETGKRPRVAAIYTSFTYRSHAHVLLENFLEPYLFCGKKTDPGVEVVSLYRDQQPDGDMTDQISKKYGIPVFKTIREAVCVGGDTLAVDAVLSIAEHGDYPVNDRGQRMYPRKKFFDQIVAVMKESKRFVPLFNDKHLSYRFDWAQEMVATAQQYNIPFLAGSSVPLAQRKPAIKIKKGTRIVQAISIHGGPVESYDFHALEVLQSMVENRRGGETGVKRLTFYEGDQVYQAAKAGIFDMELADAAMTAELGHSIGDFGKLEGEDQITPHAIVYDYVDGLKATILRVGKSSTRWNFACRIKGSATPLATSFYVGPWQNRNLFKALAHSIQTHFRNGSAPYPVERTLLTSGMVEASLQSLAGGQKRMLTPHLAVNYRAAKESTFWRR